MQTKNCHDANKKDRMQTKNCHDASKKDECKQNSFFATRLISFRGEAIRFGGFCKPDVKWEAGSGQAIAIDQYLKMYCRFYI